MTDVTENIRMNMVAQQRAEGPKERAELEVLHGKVWDTAELQDEFSVQGFAAPFVVVRRKSDGQVGSMMFQHMPRYYYSFTEDK